MITFLGFIFFFVLIIIVFGLTIINNVLRALFGLGKRNDSSARSTSSNNRSNQSTYKNQNGNAQDTPKRKKLFDDDEGEYVEFEEVKSED